MKKQWISVKCGLSRDPKHRQAMGESIWLFLHILDVTSWEDGIAHDWKDEAAAEEMGMPVRTLREHRRRLDELGYITCKQKQYTQDIIVHNWTNPREYGGHKYNEKQGGSETEAREIEQGYIQGDTQGSTKDVTPTSNSKNQISNGGKPPIDTLPIDWQLLGDRPIVMPNEKLAQQKDAAANIGIGLGALAQDAVALAVAFQAERGIVFPDSKIKGQRKAAKSLIQQGVKPEHVIEAVRKLVAAGMTVTDLYSVEKTAVDLANKPEEYYTGQPKPHAL